MKKILFTCLFFLSISSSHAGNYFWTSAVPREIHLLPHGLVLIGDFEQNGIDCASGPRAIYLAKLDTSFKEKLTLALTAKATNKQIRTVISEPRQYNCIQILATGSIPIASPYFWQLVD